MFNESAHIPYENKDGEEIDFFEKRMEFWVETVPSEIRRYEYELWKRYRKIHQISYFKHLNREKIGRFISEPEYDQNKENEDWDDFKNSFLIGDERKNRFQEVVQLANSFSKEFIASRSAKTKKDFESEVLLSAITGSSFYGPRKKGEFLSDIDINYLLDDNTSASNFEVLPHINDSPPVHITGNGYTDEGKSTREQIHWLLYPHYPIKNKISNEKLKFIIENLVQSTTDRKDKINNELADLDFKINFMKRSEVRD